MQYCTVQYDAIKRRMSLNLISAAMRVFIVKDSLSLTSFATTKTLEQFDQYLGRIRVSAHCGASTMNICGTGAPLGADAEASKTYV